MNVVTFLCDHYRDGENPPIPNDQMDSNSWYDRDMRQTTAMKMVGHFRSHNVDFSEESFPGLLGDNGGLVIVKHKDTRRRANEAKRKYGKNKDLQNPITISLECGNNDEPFTLSYSEKEIEEFESGLDLLHELWASSTDTERKAILILSEWQRRKLMNECTNNLRSSLYEIKKKLKREGSKFNCKPWML